ncbi:DNA-3-methyladenine glycosylase 2 family protein [Aestuariirhabdus sp. Z084]|uniref:DNA-3-methyladenine glycosylase family protein n=1 Tax=Aestuariirhabdus haliotis TaxID=2918751 RepID=UPI00201B3FF1|nr:DNA-3-methyladenine glycosylase 2 family protein [Aestuariirhabdus haliotis]MCL6414156.1 DNA-3-methyladenine glycosylase 2 family protein [Aestuariirhabdus haliotis]MCL6418088.1 DNA-3-methyladenine glycosylase 2 family protein [Aestuariirhabdus haliotis]
MNKRQIAADLALLVTRDSQLANALAQVGPPPPRNRPAGFETFLSTIVSQQISTEAARAILGRVTALMPELSAPALLKLNSQDLRDAGLSFRKIEYAQGLAAAIVNGEFDIDALAQLDDADAIKAITALRGFGRWSAEIYLMFSLKRRDIFPADDLALLIALGRLKQLPGKPTPAQARELTTHWAPMRTTGALFLWHYYRGAPT